MSYFQPYLDTDGLHFPTYQERLEELISGYKRIFGADVYLGEDSQDYQLLSLFAKYHDDLTAMIVDVYNARNPNLADGTALDHLLPISGIRRLAATRSTANLILDGQAGATLPANAQARDTGGKLWRIAEAVTFGEDGTAEAEASCLTSGAVAADANTICMIDTPTSIWRAVTNPLPAVPGRDVETDAAARERRALSVSLPSRSIIEGIVAALRNVDGVEYIAVHENATGSIDEDGLPAHSICAVVSGGEDEAIAEVLYLKKSPGVATYGNTSAVYTDEYKSENVIYFSRPANVMVSIQITIRRLLGWDDVTMRSAIPEAVAKAVNGIGIGSDLVVSTLFGVVFAVNEGDSLTFAVTAITASTDSQPQTADTVACAYNQRLITDADHITLAVLEGGT